MQSGGWTEAALFLDEVLRKFDKALEGVSEIFIDLLRDLNLSKPALFGMVFVANEKMS